MKKIVVCLVMSSFIGAGFLAVNIGYFNITLFKIFLIISLLGFLLSSFNNLKISLPAINQKYLIFVFIWFIYSLVSGLWVKDYRNWMKYNYYLFVFILFLFLLLKYFKSINDIKLIWKTLFIFIIIINLIGWFEIVTNIYLFSDNTNSVVIIAKSNRNPIAFMGNPNDFAITMLFGFFLTYIVGAEWKSKLFKKWIVLLKLSCILLIVFTQSRSVLVGLGIGCIWVLLLKSRKESNRYLLYGLFVIPMGAAFLLRSVDFDFSMKTLNSESIRINLIRNGLYFLKRTAGLGVGGGNIEYWMQTSSKYNAGSAINMHNWWIEILVCYGIFIFALYLLFYAKLFFSLYKKFKTSSYCRYMQSIIGITGFMVAFIIGSVGSSSLFSNLGLWFIWSLFIVYDIQLSRSNKVPLS